MRRFPTALLVTVMLASWSSAVAHPFVPDDFEDGTTMGWFQSGPNSQAPDGPRNIATGGPQGVDDAFLRLVATGGDGPGSRLVGENINQWAGDYIADGVTAIRMDLRNFGDTDLYLRLGFLQQGAAGGGGGSGGGGGGGQGPQGIPAAFSITPIVLLASSGWTTMEFPTVPSALRSANNKSVDDSLSGAAMLRIYHSVPPLISTPDNRAAPVVAELGVDNIAPLVDAPEPGTWALLLLGLMGIFTVGRRRVSAIRDPETNGRGIRADELPNGS